MRLINNFHLQGAAVAAASFSLCLPARPGRACPLTAEGQRRACRTGHGGGGRSRRGPREWLECGGSIHRPRLWDKPASGAHHRVAPDRPGILPSERWRRWDLLAVGWGGSPSPATPTLPIPCSGSRSRRVTTAAMVRGVAKHDTKTFVAFGSVHPPGGLQREVPDTYSQTKK